MEEELIRAKEDLLRVKLEYEEKLHKLNSIATLHGLRTPNESANKLLDELLAEEMLKTQEKLPLTSSIGYASQRIGNSNQSEPYVDPFRQSQTENQEKPVINETIEESTILQERSLNKNTREEHVEFSFEARSQEEGDFDQQSEPFRLNLENSAQKVNPPANTLADYQSPDRKSVKSTESEPFQTARGVSHRGNIGDTDRKDEEQAEEINLLIQNISKKLESSHFLIILKSIVAKNNRVDNRETSPNKTQNQNQSSPLRIEDLSSNEKTTENKEEKSSQSKIEEEKPKSGAKVTSDIKKGRNYHIG